MSCFSTEKNIAYSYTSLARIHSFASGSKQGGIFWKNVKSYFNYLTMRSLSPKVEGPSEKDFNFCKPFVTLSNIEVISNYKYLVNFSIQIICSVLKAKQ